jgi:hypothetical protein
MDIAVAMVSFFFLVGAWIVLPSSPKVKPEAHAKLDVVSRSAAA